LGVRARRTCTGAAFSDRSILVESRFKMYRGTATVKSSPFESRKFRLAFFGSFFETSEPTEFAT
jgi:hypothetical protein